MSTKAELSAEQIAERTALESRLAFLEGLPRITALMLCDFAQVDASGKVSIIGGGWSLTDSRRPYALLMTIRTPARSADVTHSLALALLDEAGQPVLGDDGAPVGAALSFMPNQVAAQPPGAPLCSAIVVNVPVLPLRPGGAYRWSIAIDGEPSASTTFSVLAGT